MESQLASSVLMIRPVRFESNPQTAASNRFQEDVDAPPAEQNMAATEEFDSLVAALRGRGVDVHVFEDTVVPHTPDSVFPNNWVSFHASGQVVLYPMEAPNRRTERRMDIVDDLANERGFRVSEVIDLSAHEQEGHFLEGTGSMVLDRVNRIAFACLSSRTHLDPLGDFAQRMNYDVVAFEAVDRSGIPIYHTNVLMNVGEELAVMCAEAIPRSDQREAILHRLRETGHHTLLLSYDQLAAFAGNMLELRSGDGSRLVALSQQAFDALDSAQRDALSDNGDVVSVPINNIEASAGGSVRCMLAEIHLPKDDPNEDP